MDIKQIERQGIRPIQDELDRISGLQDLPQLQTEVARLQTQGVGALFFFGAGQDDRDSTQMIALARQGGLGLPARDYYIDQDDRTRSIRAQYQEHVKRMFVLAGDSPADAAAHASTVIAIETQMAQASKSRVELRDPEANYHRESAAELQELTPSFPWGNYFRELGFPSIRVINVGQPEFFKSLNQQLASVPLDNWKSYLRWHLIHSYSTVLSSPFADENFNFYGKVLTGAKEIQPRWKRCVSSTDRNLGEALGQKYVERVFPAAAKASAQTMVRNLVTALHTDLETLSWMSASTREQALAKLAAMSLKVGYPDVWRDYSAYEVVRGSYAENIRRGSMFETARNLRKIGQPVDRTEWDMTPPTVNAYYDPNRNEIVFPAGILQPPFFDAAADEALNYGGIGAVIGHEMTHGFDDEGRQYDATGNLRNWWTAEDVKNFQARADCIEKQFSRFVVAEGVHENGKLVLGESIADLGGVTIAHMALQRAMGGSSTNLIDGFTPEQRFFLGWARVWGTVARPEYELQSTKTDPHPLPRFRTNGVVTNLPEFANAFSCKAGDLMVKDNSEQCKIW